MKRKIICCLILAVVGVIVGILGCTTNSADNILKNISSELGIDVCGGEIVRSEDTHSTFHNDGNLLVAIKFADNGIERSLANSKEWQAFPLDETAQTLLYGREIDGGRVGPFVTDREGNTLFPPVSKGYYWLRDRQSEASQSATNCLSNFAIAVYDEQKNMLYYCKMDT